MQEGLRLLMERDRALEARLEELRGEIAVGLEQARRGELLPGGEAFEKLRERSALVQYVYYNRDGASGLLPNR